MDLDKINRQAIAIANSRDIEPSEALSIMNKTHVTLIGNHTLNESINLQVSLLTTLNIMGRVCLGGVNVSIPDNIPNLTKFKGTSFNELVSQYGGKIGSKNEGLYRIVFGMPCPDENSIESISNGWQGGINFYGQRRVLLNDQPNNVLLGSIISASLASYFMTNKIYGIIENLLEMNTGLSLWNLQADNDWYRDEYQGVDNPYLPDSLWTLGLGHLGQAYLWTLGFLPFKSPESTKILLQDMDIIGDENIGSQVLSRSIDVGRPKTRVCCSFLENLGFKTQLIEKPYQKEDLLQEWMKEYPFVLNGVDNVKTRKGILKDKLKLFLDGGTNGSSDLFDSFTLKNVKSINKTPNEIWGSKELSDVVLHKNLYERYNKKYDCGVLSNVGISTPYVGMFGASIVISELVRALNKGPKYTIVSLQMRDLLSADVISNGNYEDELLRYSL